MLEMPGIEGYGRAITGRNNNMVRVGRQVEGGVRALVSGAGVLGKRSRGGSPGCWHSRARRRRAFTRARYAVRYVTLTRHLLSEPSPARLHR